MLRRSAHVAVGVLALVLGGTASARGLRAADSITVSNTVSTAVSSGIALDPTHRYRLVATGTVSDWCTTSSCPAGNADQTAQPNVGVDALYCYAKWRCPTPELWRQLQVNSMGIDQLAKMDGKIAYSGGHSYTIEFTGVSGKLSFVAADAVGSAGDNSGSFKVQLTDLGASGASSSTGKVDAAAAVRNTPQYRTFLGLDDPKDPNWKADTSRRCSDLASTVNAFPGVHSTGHLAGEEATGVHSSQLYYPGSDLFVLLSGNDPPADLFKGNVYARATPYYESQLREKILASSGDLQPADVMQMALQATGGSYGLAVLTAHNLLKNVTKTGRETLGELAQDQNWNRPAKRQNLLDQMDKLDQVVGKLSSLRADPADPANQDKMGPWYHAFAILTAGALIDPAAGIGVTLAEHGAKALKAFGNEGGFNAEKAAIDSCFAIRAVTDLKSVSRWTGSRSK